MVLMSFFQAEDGIRDIGVTGVQTCALPIFEYRSITLFEPALRWLGARWVPPGRGGRCNLKCGLCLDQSHLAQSPRPPALGRSLDVRRCFVHLGLDAFCWTIPNSSS